MKRDYSHVTAHPSHRGGPFLRCWYQNDQGGYDYDVLYDRDPGYNPDLAHILLAAQTATLHHIAQYSKRKPK